MLNVQSGKLTTILQSFKYKLEAKRYVMLDNFLLGIVMFSMYLYMLTVNLPFSYSVAFFVCEVYQTNGYVIEKCMNVCKNTTAY